MTATMDESLTTKYPILLVHGAGFRDDTKVFNYWGRIPAELEKSGARVFYSSHDAWGSIEECAVQIREQVLRIEAETGLSKLNIIAHSKGGLDSRYLVSSLGMEDKIASITTVSTPHHGSKTIDLVLRLPAFLFMILCPLVSRFFTLLGDRKADFGTAVRSFSTAAMKAFNEAHPDSPTVLYQSYAGRMLSPWSDLLFFWQNLIIGLIEGENDGLVTVESARHGDWKGLIGAGLGLGISHADEVDLWRKSKRKFDICVFYAEVVAGLKAKGL
jgi:triacylglycerol lipase